MMRWLKEKLGPQNRQTLFRLLVGIFFALIVTASTLNFDFFRIEAYFYDLRMRLKGGESLDSRIQLLVLESDEQNTLESHLILLKKLKESRAASLAFLNKFDSSDIEANPKLAEEFVSHVREAEKNGTKVILGSDLDLGGEILPPYPLSLLQHSPAVLHKDGTIFGEDKITRRALLLAMGEPALHIRLANPGKSREELINIATNYRGAYFFKPADAWHLLIHYPNRTENSFNHYNRISAQEYLLHSNSYPMENKIVLIDFIRKEAQNDYLFTPYSRITYTNPRIHIHAAILHTLLNNNGMVILSNKIDVALTFLFSILLTIITLNYSPTRGVIAMLAASAILFILSLLLFYFGLWLRLVHPLFSLFCTYYLIVPYRAILEYKKRWEVQQKHDLLLRVEEMKGNFLSLMSHDLKTPVARIQGLAELIRKQGNLSSNQNDELHQIIDSTESLDKFISKILQLTRIESSEIKLNRRAKDVNKIIEGCLDKLAFQAKQKNIIINRRLEPLFPISLDAALIIQVFTNILDNAIKYSPADSEIFVSSQELNNQVEVRIKDLGAGISPEEQEQLFTKFFRGKDRGEDLIKGSGLGLYLSKYFIELHEGSIRVESSPGKGSEFIICLPITSA